MNIAFVGPVPPIRGGIAQHSARLIEAIQELGHDCSIHSWQAQYPRMLYRRDERDPVAQALPGTSWSLRWWDPFSWRRVGKTLRQADRMVIPWTVPFHGPHLLSIMRQAGVSVSIHVHNALPHEPMLGSRWMARRVLGRADRLVTHAASVRADCWELLGERPVTVVPHPPDLPVVARPLPGGPLRLLALGYLREYKGTEVAIRAVGRLAAEGHDVGLTIAGEPWDGKRGPWAELVRSLDLDGRVRLLLDYQSDSAVGELIADHHALIAPYLTATQSGVVAQALAGGRPVVATSVGGLPDVISEGVNGALASPGDVDSLAAAIMRVQHNLETLAAGADAMKLSWADVAAALVED